MNQLERRKLKMEAAQTLEEMGNNPRKLMLLHTAASSVLALLTALLSFLLGQKIGDTGGLGGIGLRSVLETAQSMLSMVSMIVIPFWSMGLVQVFMQISRRQNAQAGDLLTGFRLFAPVLKAKLLQSLMLMAAGFVGSYVAILLFSITPWGRELYAVMEPYAMEEAIDYAALMADEAVMRAMTWPMVAMVLGMFVAMVPLYYRLRLMDYVLLDAPQQGARNAMRVSKTIMRGKGFDLFKLDLSFWWFYLLEVVVAVLCYGDVLLPMLGVDLGMSPDTAYFVFYILGLAVQLGLYVWKKPLLMTAYTRYYDAVLPKPAPATPPAVEYTM